MTHFCAKMCAPCAGVPLPGGTPVLSGWMLISQRATSASDIGCPSPGPSAARAGPAPKASATEKARGLSIDMFHLPAPVDRPTRDAVVMLVREAQHVRDLLG